TGRNFSGAAGRLQVLFGSTPATSATVVDDGHVVAVAPAGSGTVDVRVQSGANVGGRPDNVTSPVFGYGVSAVTAAARFTFGTVTNPPPNIVATGADVGGGPVVRLFDAATGATVAEFLAYDARFRGGVRVAVGDVTGDGVADIVTAPGPSGGPDVRIWD